MSRKMDRAAVVIKREQLTVAYTHYKSHCLNLGILQACKN